MLKICKEILGFPYFDIVLNLILVVSLSCTQKRRFEMQELKPIKEGKVREIYDNGDNLIMVATDRISCFDVILNNEVTKKRNCFNTDVKILV